MINAVAGGNTNLVRMPERQAEAPALIDVRAQQGRQMAIAAHKAEHAQKVQVAVEAYANFYAERTDNSTAAVGHANKSYGEF